MSKQPLYQDGHRPKASNHGIKTATRPQAQLKAATGPATDCIKTAPQQTMAAMKVLKTKMKLKARASSSMKAAAKRKAKAKQADGTKWQMGALKESAAMLVDICLTSLDCFDPASDPTRFSPHYYLIDGIFNLLHT